MTEQSNESIENKPAYKQFWPWFIFSIPFLTVVAGVITYFIAANQPHSMVKDDYFKEGLAINQSIAKQNKAVALSISVELSAEHNTQTLTAQFAEPIKAQQINILFSHPTQSNKDITITLDKLTQTQFVGQLPQDISTNWYIRISDLEDTWLLKSRWDLNRQKTVTISYQNQ